ncbi:MAG: DUF1800 domain-containing protein, partial [Planctomycetota bacterium]|nr:DUF1800 domain-containing protein [Planctomycetota bacterium]
MKYRQWMWQGVLVAGLIGGANAQESQVLESYGELEWTAGQVEHLLNRAAFGATTAEVRDWQEAGPDALIQFLLEEGQAPKGFKYKTHRADYKGMVAGNSDDKRKERARIRRLNKAQINDFSEWWIQQMIRSEDPLRERMTLIFHGWLVSGANKVKQSDYMIQQNQLFREHALGNYGELLGQIVEDPAMLLYLDNNTNRRNKPNENLARELMELFSLGEGNYTEEDVRQAARALTGYTVRQDGFAFAIRQHDPDPIQVLGYKGSMDGQDLVALLLEQPACSRYVATRLITEFEGIAPTEERLQVYSKVLVDGDYELKPFLRQLFGDPQFYRPEVLGAKVQSPVDFVVGSCRRLQVEPDIEMLSGTISMLGQTLLSPPSVKGWDGGLAWLSEASSIMRSNVIGAMIGQVSPVDLREGVTEAMEHMDEMMDDSNMSDDGTSDKPKSRGGPLARLLNQVKRKNLAVKVPVLDWLQSQKATKDTQIARVLLDQLLAVAPDPDTERRVTQFIKLGRKRMNIKEGKINKTPEKSRLLLMQAVHLILSLPEANL